MAKTAKPKKTKSVKATKTTKRTRRAPTSFRELPAATRRTLANLEVW